SLLAGPESIHRSRVSHGEISARAIARLKNGAPGADTWNATHAGPAGKMVEGARPGTRRQRAGHQGRLSRSRQSLASRSVRIGCAAAAESAGKARRVERGRRAPRELPAAESGCIGRFAPPSAVGRGTAAARHRVAAPRALPPRVGSAAALDLGTHGD